MPELADFAVGDRVRVTKETDWLYGRVGTVIAIDDDLDDDGIPNDHGVQVDIDDLDENPSYPNGWLEKI